MSLFLDQQLASALAEPILLEVGGVSDSAFGPELVWLDPWLRSLLQRNLLLRYPTILEGLAQLCLIPRAEGWIRKTGRSCPRLATTMRNPNERGREPDMTARKWAWAMLTMVMLIGGCQNARGGGGAPATGDPAKLAEKHKDPLSGFIFNLSEGNADAGALEQVKAAQLTPLSDQQLTALLKRLPEFKARPYNTDFALREKSLPPPRTGDNILVAWPPPPKNVKPDEVEAKALEVLRHAPEGDVPIAPQLSVTFNKPMVAVTSHEELAKLQPPVKLSPQPEGHWRWIGTRTVLFDPRGEVSPGSTQQARFPMATEYKVEVPAGTRAADGSTLEKATSWTFNTPTVTMTGSSPQGGPQALEPLIWVSFNQDIDQAAVLKTIKLEGAAPVTLRMATPDELKPSGLDPKTPKRWVAFKATTPLKAATTYTVTIGPGTPSAEGSLLTRTPQSFSFSTYDKFVVTTHGCGYDQACPPLSPFYISFNNPIDVEKFDPDMVKITPEIPKMKIETSGSGISIRGQTKGRTTYKAVLASSLPDSFGQTLGSQQELTFTTGSAQPQLTAPGELLVTTDPNEPTSFPLYVMNEPGLKVRINSVEPKDWKEFQLRLASETEKNPFVPPGQEVVNRSITTGAKTDELTEVKIDLKPALHNGKGMAVVVVETPGRILNWWDRKRVVKWVQVTDVGIDAAVDSQVMQVMTTDLKTGNTLSGVDLKLLNEAFSPAASGVSAENGLAALTLPDVSAGMLVASKGDDISILPQSASYYGYGGWQKSILADQMRWFVVDDRKMYRPDEKVSIKGWVRRYQAGPKGDIAGMKGELSNISWQLNDAVGNKVLEGTTKVTSEGSFNLDFTLPKTINLGYTNLSLSGPSSLGGSSYNHSFQVQEFRRPEFEVSASVSPDASVIGESATATVEARYYSGGGLPGAPVTWTVSTSAGSYSPPGHDGFSFGTWTPWWTVYDYWEGRGRYNPVPQDAYKNFESRTDSSGIQHLKMDFVSVDPPRPTVVRAEASVSDVNRQAWNANTSILVHPSDYYVGLRSKKTFVEKGEPLELELVACHRDGKTVPDVPVEIAVWRNDYKIEKGQYKESREDLQAKTVTSEAEPKKLTFNAGDGGTYTVKARITDPQGRSNESTMTLWVSGAEAPPAGNMKQQQLTLIPNQKEYKVGDTAEILVQAPVAPAEGLVTWRRSGILKTERVSLKEPSTVLKVPIEDSQVPNLYVQVDLTGQATTVSGGKQPAYASGQLNLSVPPLQRSLTVEVKPVHPNTDPGAKTSIDVLVKDADGKPVDNAEISLFAVDEAVLALTGYQFPNPLDVFYAQRGPETSDVHSRQYVVLTKMEEVVEATTESESANYMYASKGSGRATGVSRRESAPAPSAAPTGGMAMEGADFAADATLQFDKRSAESFDDGLVAGGGGAPNADGAPIKMRTDFNPTALFAPVVKTDVTGKAAVPFKLPDNLTRYRLVALATDGGKKFGKGESALVARLPLMVRPSAPRFLNFGDAFELPVVLQNQTDQDMDVLVGTRAVNLKLTGAAGYSLKIPANDRVEVRFPAAADRAGKADLQVGAVGPGEAADAAEVSLPVWTPATTEAFATYGEIDNGAIAQPVKPPGEVWPQFGGLEITTTSTALQSLTDAFIYLVSYPFDCSEQVSSRLLGIAALRDVLWAFKAEGIPTAAELNEQVQHDMDRLSMLQNSNGGFGFWPTSSETWPYISVHVGHALARAKEKGYKVPETMLAQSQSYMANVESYIPYWYGEDEKRVIRAYALYVRHRLGDTDKAKVKELIAEVGGITKLPIEAMGFLYYVICKDPDHSGEVAEIRKYLNNHVTETAGNAHFVTGYNEESGYVILSSDRRVDGILLEAMITDQPKNDLIPKIARGLLAGRDRGRWSNTQDNCFVLLALDLYFHTYEKVTPDFVARAWLGDEFVGQQTFKGREVDYKTTRIPMSYLADKGEKVLTLSKEGEGRLYYRLGMDYAPKDLKLAAADHGFAVERVYEGVDKPEDVKQDQDGTWRIKAGAKVRVKLTMVATARRYHVALVDPLPAGLEPMNPALAVTGTVPNDPAQQQSRGPWWYWMGTWYEHQNMRDERVEAFTSLLWEGVYGYNYVARATTPGAFVVPPTKVEEMYAPETFGRSATDRVIVE